MISNDEIFMLIDSMARARGLKLSDEERQIIFARVAFEDVITDIIPRELYRIKKERLA